MDREIESRQAIGREVAFFKESFLVFIKLFRSPKSPPLSHQRIFVISSGSQVQIFNAVVVNAVFFSNGDSISVTSRFVEKWPKLVKKTPKMKML
jgi:hypothetical protein